MLSQQLLEDWLRPLGLQTLSGGGLPPMTRGTETWPFESTWDHSEGPCQSQNVKQNSQRAQF